MDILERLKWRYAVKKFDPQKKLSEEQFQNLLEAARLAPSSYGLQPWRFVVVRDPAVRAKLKEKSWNQSQITDASHLIVFSRVDTIDEVYVDRYLDEIAKIRGVSRLVLEDFARIMKSFLKDFGDAERIAWMENQVYLALGTFLTSCAVLGIDACPMEGFEKKAYDAILNFEKKGLRSVVLCTVGYRSEQDEFAKMTKVRIPLKDLLLEV